MAAATSDRDTLKRLSGRRAYPVAANKSCFLGCLAVLSAGRLQPMTTALNLVCVGVFNQASINAAQDTLVEIERDQEYRFNNSAAGDAIALTDVGNDCYGVDDNTVAKTDGGGTRSKAGVIVDVDAQGVWIKFKQ
jgi:hypothetical protein